MMKSCFAVIAVLLCSTVANAQVRWQQLDPENVLVIDTVMTKVRVLADLPAPERPDVSLPDKSAMAELIARIRSSKGADFSVCDVEVPARIVAPALPQDRRDLLRELEGYAR